MEDKASLLNSLKIDRAEPAAPGRGGARWPGVALALLLGIGAGGGAAWWLLLSGHGDGARVQAPQAAPAAPQGQAAPAAPAPGTPAPAAEVRPAGSLVASGYIVARRIATVSAEITGRVQEVRVEEGMAVEQGQVLARLDDTLARIDLDLSKARVQSAEASVQSTAADLRDAERTLTRTTALSGQKVASDADLIRAQARAESLRAQLRRAQADVEIARISVARNAEAVDRHLVRAPFAGVVTEKNAQPGEIISPMSSGGFTRTGVCTLVDMASLEIEVDVNEASIARVKPGQKVEAVLDAYPDWKVPARVVAVIPTANRDKATIKVRIGLDTRDARVLPNMAAKVTFLEDRTSHS